MTSSRPEQRGLVRGCCLGLLAILATVGYAAFIVDRAIADPDLGAPPRGPDHGATEVAIALALAPQLAADLIARPHAVITLSEHDLTVIVAANNPKPNEYRNVVVRVRNGLVVVAATVSTGPLMPTALARVNLVYQSVNGQPSVSSQVAEVDIGQLTLPGWLRDRFVGQITESTALDRLFNGDPILKAAVSTVECVSVTQDGLRIGVHRPGEIPDSSMCRS